ncbi:hypothetical protein ACVWXO_008867 [Bradyrhizobium sp. LM2.7]
MLKDGTYAAWFKTPLGQGTGIVHVADGKIWGRDDAMTYSGLYKADGRSLFRSRENRKTHRRARKYLWY